MWNFFTVESTGVRGSSWSRKQMQNVIYLNLQSAHVIRVVAAGVLTIPEGSPGWPVPWSFLYIPWHFQCLVQKSLYALLERSVHAWTKKWMKLFPFLCAGGDAGLWDMASCTSTWVSETDRAWSPSAVSLGKSPGVMGPHSVPPVMTQDATITRLGLKKLWCRSELCPSPRSDWPFKHVP